MFCPKCGTENPESGKFCRSCGVDLGNVSAALSGELPANFSDAGAAHIHHEAKRRNDPHEVYADSIKSIISGLGFLIVSIALLTTGVAGGKAWWWAMLFPAFTFLAKGISNYLKYKKMEQSRVNFAPAPANVIGQQRSNTALPPLQTEYVSPESRYKTGDLVPPSVTDNTTRHLEMDSEGQTMTLPKKH
ncbi:MAG TPA: zinc-ribbon domain-containing protein [Pyrinomonadaceae bacterium]|nr:zinc-ribbon domain-containing protein [Pyrinomonadaceae bacterium]